MTDSVRPLIIASDTDSRDVAFGEENIITSSLNNTSLSEPVEFTKFEKSVNDYILLNLGAPVIRVELVPQQIKAIIDQSVTKFSYHAPSWTSHFYTFRTAAGRNLYELPKHVLDNLTYVVYKKSLLSIQAQAGTLEFDFFIKYFQDNFLFSDFEVGDFLLMQMHLEQIRKVLGQEGTWDIVNNKYLQLYPVPTEYDQVIVEYRALDSDTIHPSYKNWIQQYALALAKILLGRIRGKYKILPSPGGGASLDGAELSQEGAREKENLEERLLDEFEDPPMWSTF